MSFRYFLKDIYLRLRYLVLILFVRSSDYKQIDRGKVNSVVIIRIDRIGDVVVSLPSIFALKQVYPNSRIAVVLRPENIPLLKNIPWIDELIPYRGFINTLNILHKKKFYMAVDLLMDYSFKTALVTFLSKANITAGFDIEGRGRFFNLAFKPGRQKKQMSAHLLDLVKFIAGVSGVGEGDIKELVPKLSLSEEDRLFVGAFLRANGIEEGDIIIGLHPGGYFPSQCWMLESFAELINRISKKYKSRFIIMGSSKEEGLIRRLVSLTEVKPVLAVGLSLDKLASVIAGLSLFIGNNSGPMHIACALNISTVSTMGPTDPQLWRPPAEGHIVVRKELACSPCSRPNCRQHECMRLISVDDMVRAVSLQIEGVNNV